MRIGSVDAPSITFADNGSVSNPNLGEVAADIFEFEIQGDNDEDVMVESITFEGSSDAEDDLRNFELLMGNTVVATTAMMSGDYLTFDLDGLLIQEDKNVDFTVRADVIEGAGDIISFGIDAKLDVTANSTKFGFGAGVVIAGFNPPSITIQAGELTFIEVESDIDEIREDKDNVVLATFKIINLSGNGLELADFAAQIAMTDAATTTVGSISPVAAVPSSIFTEVELYNMETGSSYTLDASSLTAATVKFADTNIDALIGEGTTTWMIRADTAEDINGFDNISFDVSINLATEDSSGNAINDIVINETTDDERVIDITPSSLSFNSIDGSESGASINVLSLSPSIDVVRGANNVVAFEFEVEAEQVSSLTVDELTVALFSDQGPSISSVDGTTPVTTQTIAVTVNTAPTLGDMYSITVNGTTYTYTAVSGATTTTVATALASQIAGATSAAAVMTIPATTITYPAGQYTQATPLASNVFTASVELGNVNGTFSYQVNVNGTTTIAATTAAALAANITANVTNVTATANGDKITLTSTGAITITAPVTTGTATNVAATKQQISLVNLYKDSVSAANLLDGDSLSNLGTVTFSNMGDVMIPANGKQKFVVTVSLVDGNDAVTGSAYRASLTAISITDDENDDIVVTLPVASNRSIAVTNSGTIATLFLDPANADNEFDKLGLAGDASIIASWDVRANDETIDVEVVTFTLGGVSTAVVDSLKSSVATADILLNGVVVGTASNSDISSTNMGVGTIIFDDLTALILPETTGELALRLNTANIGRNLVGQTQTGLTVTNIALSKAEGNESGKVVADLSVAAPSQTLDIVSAVVTPSITAVLSNTNTTAKLRLVVAGGNNTTANGDAVQAELTSLKIAYTGNMAGQTATVKNSTGLTVGTANFDAATDTANEIVVSVTSDSIGNSNEVYEIIIDRVATSSNTFDIAQDGVTYTINGANTTTVKLNNTLDLGEYTVTN
jgi:hypothetical protein